MEYGITPKEDMSSMRFDINEHPIDKKLLNSFLNDFDYIDEGEKDDINKTIEEDLVKINDKTENQIILEDTKMNVNKTKVKIKPKVQENHSIIASTKTDTRNEIDIQKLKTSLQKEKSRNFQEKYQKERTKSRFAFYDRTKENSANVCIFENNFELASCNKCILDILKFF